MKNKLDKYVARAFEEAGVIQPDTCKTVSDLNLWLEDLRADVDRLKVNIEEAKQHVIDMEESIVLLKSVQHQIKVERYKDLNPNAEVI